MGNPNFRSRGKQAKLISRKVKQAKEERIQHTPAAAHVFGVSELVTKIIVNIPPRDILTKALRVCRKWKAIIDESTPIQQALFFKPVTTGELRYSSEKNFWALASNPHSPVKILGHSLLRQMKDGPFRSGDLNKARFTRPQASWRRLLISQPPVVVELKQCEICLESWGYSDHAVPDGLTMEEILRIYKDTCGDSPCIKGEHLWEVGVDTEQTAFQVLERIKR